MIRNEVDYEAGADVRFGLAYERLQAQDEAESAWLDRVCRVPDPDEVAAAAPPMNKTHPPAEGRCMRWGCRRSVRCKGLCDHHYFQERQRIRLEKRGPRPKDYCKVCKERWPRTGYGGRCIQCAKAAAAAEAR